MKSLYFIIACALLLLGSCKKEEAKKELINQPAPLPEIELMDAGDNGRENSCGGTQETPVYITFRAFAPTAIDTAYDLYKIYYSSNEAFSTPDSFDGDKTTLWIGTILVRDDSSRIKKAFNSFSTHAALKYGKIYMRVYSPEYNAYSKTIYQTFKP